MRNNKFKIQFNSNSDTMRSRFDSQTINNVYCAKIIHVERQYYWYIENIFFVERTTVVLDRNENSFFRFVLFFHFHSG